jgi:hypothetical protein
MGQKRHKPKEIVANLREVEVLLSQGKAIAEAIRSIGVRRSPTKIVNASKGGSQIH